MLKNSKLLKGLFNWSVLLIIIAATILINTIGSYLYFRIDMTKDQRYSLAQGTEKFLNDKSKIESRISIQVYLEGNLPAEIQNFQNSLKDKLNDFKSIAGNRIEFNFINPQNGSKENQQELFVQLYDQSRGILPLEIIYSKDGEQRQMMLWPGAKMSYSINGIVKEQVIQFLPGSKPGRPYNLAGMTDIIENALNNLEYNIISSMRKLVQKEKQRIAFLQGHGELNPNQTLRIRSLIAPYYAITDVRLNDSISALVDVDGLIIADPQAPFSNKDLYLIDQFVMRGGKLMCFMNTLYLNEDSLMARGVTHTMRKNLKLENMLFDYGLKVNENYVLDVNCAPKVIPYSDQTFIPWFFHVLATPTIHPMTKNTEPVSLKFTNEIQFIKQEKVNLTPILTSSTNSNKTGLAPLVSLSLPISYGNNPELVANPKDDTNKICIAGLAEGFFESHFQNRLVGEFANNPNAKYKVKSTNEGKVIVVGNGLFIANRYDSIPNPKGNGYLYRPNQINDLRMEPELAERDVPIYFGNQEFFQNIVDYMMGDNSVLDVRSRQIDIKEIDKEKIKTFAGFYKTINLLLPIGIVLLMAFILNYLRKRRYTQAGK